MLEVVVVCYPAKTSVAFDPERDSCSKASCTGCVAYDRSCVGIFNFSLVVHAGYPVHVAGTYMGYCSDDKSAESDAGERHAPCVLVAGLHVFSAVEAVTYVVVYFLAGYPAVHFVLLAASEALRNAAVSAWDDGLVGLRDDLYGSVPEYDLLNSGECHGIERTVQIVPGLVVDIVIIYVLDVRLDGCRIVCVDDVLCR